MAPLDPDRRAFRLVGGVLVSQLWVLISASLHLCADLSDDLILFLKVERTVREVLPTVKEHRGNVR